MQIPVLIEPISENCFRASLTPLGLSAEASTSGEAFSRLEQLVKERVASGARIRTIDVPEEHPLVRFAGTLPDDEYTAAWLQAIEEYRRERDAEDEGWEKEAA